MSCIACNDPEVRPVGRVKNRKLKHTRVIQDIPVESTLYICKHCQHIQKQPSPEREAFLPCLYEHYTDGNYSATRSQVVYVDGKTLLREDLILEAICPHLAEVESMLDVGAGMGTFLKCASKYLPTVAMYASDVTEAHLASLLTVPNFKKFYLGTLDNLDIAPFGCLVMWQSLEHVNSLPTTLQRVRALLVDDGLFLVQVPALERMPFDLTLYEHYSHFSLSTLSGLLSANGFEIIWTDQTLVHNCLTALARKTNIVSSRVDYDLKSQCSLLDSSLALLTSYERYFRNAINYDRPFVILGMATAGVWLYGILEGNPRAFVDEDPERAGLLVDGIPVIPPGELCDEDQLLLPFEPTHGKRILSRWRNSHLIPASLPILLPRDLNTP